eukprot:COSAG05_NODE_831_length_7083_cov_166.649055_5_plen_31_part_00
MYLSVHCAVVQCSIALHSEHVGGCKVSASI